MARSDAPDVMREGAADFTTTPEFQNAVTTAAAAAVAKAMPAIMAQLAQASPGAEAMPGNSAWAEQLAMAIAKLTDQNSALKYVDPAVIAKREQAKERMLALLVECRVSGDKETHPWYRLVHKTQLGEGRTLQVIDPMYRDPVDKKMKTQTIGWDGIPNMAMRPLNASAEAIFAEFLVWSGSALPNREPNFRVTAKGLIIGHRNAGDAEPLADAMREDGPGGGLIIGHRGNGDPGPIEHTLGTIAPPLRRVA